MDNLHKQVFKDVMQRVATWPDADQAELLEYALEIEARANDGHYLATAEEFEGIDRGMQAAQDGRFATEEQVTAIIAKHRSSS